MRFPVRGGEWEPPPELLERHVREYPHLNVPREYERCLSWMLDNGIIGTPRGMPARLGTWLRRAERFQPQQPAPKPTVAKLPADIWERE